MGAVTDVAWLTWWPAPLGLSLVLVGIAVIDAARAPDPARLSVSRELPPVLTLEAEGRIVWRVHNPVGHRVRTGIADALQPSLRAGRRRVSFELPPHGRGGMETRIRPERRGRFELGPLTVRVYGRLGLAARQATQHVPGELRVYPPLRSRNVAEQKLRSAQLRTGLRLAQGAGAGTEFEALREYTRDDEFRHIDWAATARVGKPIVRTFRPERNQTVLVLVDSGRTMAGQLALPDGRARLSRGDPWTVPRLDHAMDGALALTRVATGLGDAVGLVAFADRVRAVLPPRGHNDQLQRVAAALHTVDPVLDESDYRGAFVEALARFPRRALLVVLTELAEEPMAATLLPALPLVARDHLVVVAGIRDPEVTTWARMRPDDADGAYRKAAAAAAIDERRRSAARLRGAGARVVDATPDELAARLADVYLDTKLAGRL
ncbi:DUF58 domain-containing protein [Egibacter rhizosphaerae]|uniref:DUF58 domain-containing protein n=1 Tax=Egibacter rhizosphaerae TaxID=1670831 RepID=A0A411YJ74_9ACTN|nr:DUF58 domain-containing protein [Egibacter rhizosphaerae]QBI21201.1 DUF58 domain-containing protein [Egibacter rhizosphaerae]